MVFFQHHYGSPNVAFMPARRFHRAPHPTFLDPVDLLLLQAALASNKSQEQGEESLNENSKNISSGGDVSKDSMKDNKAGEEKESSKHNTDKVLFKSRSLQISANKDKITVGLDVPGVKVQDVTVSINEHEDVLQVEAVRKSSSTQQVVAKFSRRIPVDTRTVNVQEIKAALDSGVLSIILPKVNPTTTEQANAHVEVIAADLPATTTQGNNFIRSLDLPGVKHNDLSINYRDGVLDIKGERKRVGSAPSNLHLQIMIDKKTVNTSSFQAYLMDGVLTIVADNKTPLPVTNIPIVHGVVETTKQEPKNSEENKAESVEHYSVTTVTNDDDDDEVSHSKAASDGKMDGWENVSE